MDLENIGEYKLKNLNKINIVLGKNGCGKSILLRSVEQKLGANKEQFGKTKYITPERGGTLVYEAGIDHSLVTNVNWLSGQRKSNLTPSFRQQSVAQYKNLQLLVLLEFEKDQSKDKFDPYIEKINLLLDNIQIIRNEPIFKIIHKLNGNELNSNSISSGESELISLGIECLIFTKEIDENKNNFLFLDEPDVHLHPDLQARLMHFLKNLIMETNITILIATHSTAILGALESYSDTHISFMTFNQKELEFKPISKIYRKILPIFGAHPLSNIFNEMPILLVEGEDDERIWQQVIRSSEKKIKIYPCAVDSISNMNEYEVEAQKIIKAVYEDAKGYSLRDRDDNPEDIDDLSPIIRMRLSCRNAENLLMSDEVLEELNINWDKLKENINKWLDSNKEHPHFSIMDDFKNIGYDRKNFNIKELRNDLMGIIGSEKPWEVVVGKVIANQSWNQNTSFNENGKILSYLGKKVTKNILPNSDQ